MQAWGQTKTVTLPRTWTGARTQSHSAAWEGRTRRGTGWVAATFHFLLNAPPPLLPSYG